MIKFNKFGVEKYNNQRLNKNDWIIYPVCNGESPYYFNNDCCFMVSKIKKVNVDAVKAKEYVPLGRLPKNQKKFKKTLVHKNEILFIIADYKLFIKNNAEYFV